VLKAGVPPARGRKIAYYREAVFRDRVRPPPLVAARPLTPGPRRGVPRPPAPPSAKDPLQLNLIVPLLDAAGLEPLPPEGASADAVEAWVERFIDASAVIPTLEPSDGR